MTDSARQKIRIAVAVLASLLCFSAAAALSKDDEACLRCHAQDGLKKPLGKNATLSLHVSGEEFAKSVHAELGCAGCHAELDPKKHPGAARQIESARAYTLEKVAICSQCHEDKARLFEGSIHAALLRLGNLYAPVCTDCHGSHGVRGKTAEAPAQDISCRKCHEDIYDAYAGSMHGTARSKPGPLKAPICNDCHRAHDVSPASSGTRLRDTCLGCHGEAVDLHAKWLPNARTHMDVVACAACHAPGAKKRVDLRLQHPDTKERLSDPKGETTDAKALWDLLRGVNRDGSPARATLMGRLEVHTGAEAHRLARKGQAIRDCVMCHKQGAEAFQNVTISIIGPDGRPVRYAAQKDVLSNPQSVETMSDFYVLGGTRIKILDALVALALLLGVSAPIGHLLLRRILRGKPRPPEDRQPPH